MQHRGHQHHAEPIAEVEKVEQVEIVADEAQVETLSYASPTGRRGKPWWHWLLLTVCLLFSGAGSLFMLWALIANFGRHGSFEGILLSAFLLPLFAGATLSCVLRFRDDMQQDLRGDAC